MIAKCFFLTYPLQIYVINYKREHSQSVDSQRPRSSFILEQSLSTEFFMSASSPSIEHRHILYGFLHDCQPMQNLLIYRIIFVIPFGLTTIGNMPQHHNSTAISYWMFLQIGNNISIMGGVGDGDALISSEKNIFLCTRTADCVPIFLLERLKLL